MVKKLALIVSTGSFNNLVQVCTLTMAAAASDISVRIFFRDAAVLKVSKRHIKEINLSPAFASMESAILENLRKAKLDDLERVFTEVKSKGDVKFFVCTSSMAICGVKQEDLIPEIDEMRGLTSFLLEEMSEADMVLTF
ncbi:MAG: DsrE family protein [Nitrospiria bacterium]